MIKKQIGENEVILYDDIEEIPEVRREKLDTYQILGSELNPRNSGFNEKISNIAAFIESDKKIEAIDALYNFQRCFILCVNGNNLNRIAYGALVKSIDGVSNDDLSDEILDEKIKALKDLTTTEIEDTIQNVKKNY